jgi:hypothetical protein
MAGLLQALAKRPYKVVVYNWKKFLSKLSGHRGGKNSYGQYMEKG